MSCLVEMSSLVQTIATKIITSKVDIKHEGKFKSTAKVAEILQKYLNAKYTIDAAYRSFSDRMRGPFRDSLVEHFAEHAKEERQAQYDIAMRLVGMGYDPVPGIIKVPQLTFNADQDVFIGCIFKALADLELDAIKRGRELIAISGDNTAMKVFAENLILVDTQHLDDLRRMWDFLWTLLKLDWKSRKNFLILK